MSDPILEEIDRLVAKVDAEQEVWVAMRVSSKGAAAFMGVFTTLELAKERCEHDKERPYKWRLRGIPEADEWETGWFTWTDDVSVKFTVAPRPIQDTSEPISLNDRPLRISRERLEQRREEIKQRMEEQRDERRRRNFA